MEGFIMAHKAVPLTADVYLQRAFQFIQQVETATQEFRERAIAHDAEIERDQPFIEGMFNAFRSSRQLKEQKASLLNDLQLAEEDINRAVAIDRESVIDTPTGQLGPIHLRAYLLLLRGQLEMISGSPDNAIHLLSSANQLMDLPDTHYMLGILFESKYLPVDALRHFEKCLELDPAGELSVPALREAKAMRNYKKRFRGNWGIFLLLFIVFFPFAFVYFFAKRK
jgi:tetratricopeptide (TPR) repeat protein